MDINLAERPHRRQDLPRWYAAALADQARSGLSMAHYADELGVTPATLYQWRRRLATEDYAEFETPRSLGLIEVSVQDGDPIDGVDPIVVRLGNDRLVEVPRQFRDGDLVRVIQLLETCCGPPPNQWTRF